MSNTGPRTEHCEWCDAQIVTEPSWADEHIMVETRFSGGTGLKTRYYCSERCVSKSLSDQ